MEFLLVGKYSGYLVITRSSHKSQLFSFVFMGKPTLHIIMSRKFNQIDSFTHVKNSRG